MREDRKYRKHFQKSILKITTFQVSVLMSFLLVLTFAINLLMTVLELHEL
jgi:hypothetical protein